MPRITRKQQKVFAVNASNNGVFGSLQANDPVYSQDPDAIQGRTAYSNGWNDATYSAEKLPPLEEFQSLQYLFSRQIAYLMQDGIAEWNVSTTYYKGALVKAIQQDGSFILYASLIDDNTGNQVTDTTKWAITNTSTNFHQGIPNWRADVIYSQGDWVKALNDGNWSIFESTQNNNLNNPITNTSYWAIKPFTSKLPLLWHSWFDHELDDVSWLRADTFSWQDGTVYSNAYDHLVDDWNNWWATHQQSEMTHDVIDGQEVWCITASDGHKIAHVDEITSGRIDGMYNATGVAWYYILDTTNQRFKLPRENPAREELIQIIRAKGNDTAIGFTDGTNNFGLRSRGVSGSNGFLYVNKLVYGGTLGNSDSNVQNANAPGSDLFLGITTDSTKSGIISDMTDSTSVFKGNKYLYFYVGQYSQTAIEQTAGLNASLFNGKLDIDLGNVSSVTKETIIGWCMPDYTAGVSVSYTDLNAGYEAPYDGVLLCTFGLNGTFSINSIAFTVNMDGNNRIIREIHLNKGDVIKTSNQTSAYSGTNIFFPLKGVTNA